MNRSNLYQIIYLSISFVLIFISYNVAQIFQTSSDYSKDGAFAVGIIYIVLCLSNIAISPYITRLLGVRLTLILSSLTYVAFIAANIKYNQWTLYTSAFLLGFGGALLWTAQGVYVTIATNKYEEVNSLAPSSTRGYMNGLFFGIFSLNQTVGNSLASFLFRWKLDEWIIFTIMTGIAALGSFCLVFIRSLEMPKKIKQHSILSSLSILSDIPFLLLIPTMCYNGLSQGFIYAAIPPLILDKSQKFLVFALYGFVGAVSSIVFGKLSDSLVRRLIIFAIGAVAHITIFILLLVIWKPPLDQTRIDIFIILTVGLSIGDSIFTTQLYSTIGTFYGQTRPADAFACMRIFQAGCTAISFITQVYLSFSIRIFTLIILLSLSFITLIYEHYGVMSLDTGKTIMSARKDEKTKVDMEIDGAVPLTTSSDTA